MKLSDELRGISRWIRAVIGEQPIDRGVLVLKAEDFRDLLYFLSEAAKTAAEMERGLIPAHVQDDAAAPAGENILNFKAERQKRLNRYSERTKPL